MELIVSSLIFSLTSMPLEVWPGGKFVTLDWSLIFPSFSPPTTHSIGRSQSEYEGVCFMMKKEEGGWKLF